MLANLARAAFLLFLALMIVSWAAQVSKTPPDEPQGDQPIGRMYS